MFGEKYSRLKFWIIWIIVHILIGITSKIFDIFESSGNSDNTAVIISEITFILLIVLLIIAINTMANRIRDYGSNPWLALLVLVPLINTILILYYGIAKHKKGNTKAENSQKENDSSNNSSLNKSTVNHHKNVICFEVANDDSWNKIKLILLEFYKQYNIDTIISNKENLWMLGSDEISGYVEMKLNKNILTITTFKFPKPDLSIIKDEIKKSETILQTNIESNVETSINENALYEQALNEIENDTKDRAIWAKAYANSDGNKEKTKALYIKFRVKEEKKQEKIKQENIDRILDNSYEAKRVKEIQKALNNYKLE